MQHVRMHGYGRVRSTRSLPLSQSVQMFLKIDVQGAELDVLKGRADHRAFVRDQLELPNVNYNRGASCFCEILGFMKNLDLAPIVFFNRTNIHGTLAQVIIIFVRKSN